MKKVTLVNKFGPRSNAITGQNATELAEFLSAHGVEVTFICLQADYKKGKNTGDPGISPYKLIELRNFYTGRSPTKRLLFGFIDGFRLWLKSFFTKSDVMIIMTDPPLLFFWFQLFRRLKKSKLFYWTMDLYPDAFVAGKYIGASNPLYKFFAKVVYRTPPDTCIVLGKQQLEFVEKRFNQVKNPVVLPCGIVKYTGSVENNNFKKITFGYGGNIGEAHDANFLIDFVKQLEIEKHTMIVSIYGSKAEYVTNAIKHLPCVQLRKHLDYDDIAGIDINVASLLPEWHQVCVPSKAVTAICCGTSLLLNSKKDSDAWQMFQSAAWLIEPGSNYPVEIRRTLADITDQSIIEKKKNAESMALALIDQRQNAFSNILSALYKD